MLIVQTLTFAISSLSLLVGHFALSILIIYRILSLLFFKYIHCWNFQILMESYDRFLEFVKRSKAVSPTVALETATALQVISMLKVELEFVLRLV